MANYATLKAAINAVIRANGNKEITGTVLNETLTAMVNSLGADYQFAGVATPSTNPGTPDQNVFYLAGQAGTYTNFNNIVLPDGVSVLKWNGSWSSDTVVAGDGVFDISAYKATGGTLATFADLSAALDGGNNIPSALRKGGMSVKFVQSSDNKYVQARCISNEFTTDTSKWQSVDSAPQDGSKNLVESGGVAKAYDGVTGGSKEVVTTIDTIIGRTITIGLPKLSKLQKVNILVSGENISGTLYDLKVKKEDGTEITLGTLSTNTKKSVILPADIIGISYWLGAGSITATGDVTTSVTWDSAQLSSGINDIRNGFAYFEGARVPQFTRSANWGYRNYAAGESVSLTITMPTDTNLKFRIYNQNGGIFVEKLLSSLLSSYTITNTQKLVYDIDDDNVKVINADVDGHYAVLLSLEVFAVYGMLSHYYYAWVEKKDRELDVFTYIQGGNIPTFTRSSDWLYSIDDTKTITVDLTRVTSSIPDLRIINSKGGVIYTINVPELQTRTFIVDNYQKFVYDISDGTLKVVASNATGDYIDMLTLSGCAVSGALSGYYYAWVEQEIKNSTLSRDNSLFVYIQGGNLPSFTRSSNWGYERTENGELTVDFSNIPVNMPDLRIISPSKGIVYTVDVPQLETKTFTVTNYDKLVYDISDGLIKKVRSNASGNYINLISLAGHVVSGIMADYYYLWAEFENKKQIDSYPSIEDYIAENQNLSLSFVVTTDTHYLVDSGLDNRLILARSVKELAKDVHVDYFCNLGDIVRGYENDNKADMQKSMTEIVNEYVEDAPCPVLFAIGNHEDNYLYVSNHSSEADAQLISRGELYSRILKASRITYYDRFSVNKEHLCYWVDFDDVRVIMLNTQDKTGESTWKFAVSQEQVTWFTNDALNTNKKVLIMCHCPLVDSLLALSDVDLSGDIVENRDLILAAVNTFVLNGGEVVAFMCGHIHKQASVQENGIYHIAFTNGNNAEAVIINTSSKVISTKVFTPSSTVVDRTFNY